MKELFVPKCCFAGQELSDEERRKKLRENLLKKGKNLPEEDRVYLDKTGKATPDPSKAVTATPENVTLA